MLQIPQEFYNNYNLLLNDKNIPKNEHHNFRKWLRYYLDFCKKYNHSESEKESLPLFIKKMQEKHQAPNQQKQAKYAITLYYSLLRSDSKNHLSDFNKKLPGEDKSLIKQNQSSRYVQKDNSKGQPNSVNFKSNVTFEKTKTNRKNQISHSSTYNHSIIKCNCNGLANSVNENIPDYNINL